MLSTSLTIFCNIRCLESEPGSGYRLLVLFFNGIGGKDEQNSSKSLDAKISSTPCNTRIPEPRRFVAFDVIVTILVVILLRVWSGPISIKTVAPVSRQVSTVLIYLTLATA